MIALLKRDLTIALRAGGGVVLALAFFFIVVVLVPLGIGTDRGVLQQIAPGVFWVAALLASLLSLDRIFALDYEDGSLALLATSPLPLEMVGFSKSLSHWLSTGLPLAIATPVLGFMLNLHPDARLPAALSLLLGTPALSAIGAFGAALTVSLRRGGLLLSLLVLPLYIPTMMFGARVAILAGQGLDYGTELILVSAISLGSLALLPFATAATLKVTLKD